MEIPQASVGDSARSVRVTEQGLLESLGFHPRALYLTALVLFGGGGGGVGGFVLFLKPGQ